MQRYYACIITSALCRDSTLAWDQPCVDWILYELHKLVQDLQKVCGMNSGSAGLLFIPKVTQAYYAMC